MDLLQVADAGQISVDPQVADGAHDHIILIGKVIVKDGKAVGFEPICDYHMFPGKYGGVYTCSRPVVDRAKYPNWPNPEPASVP